jgi:lysophospholipase L1-like esterase
VLQPGDFVFIQFGINDRATDTARKAPTGGVFESYLTKYITEARAKGAFPVLVSTARRNSWNADGVTVYDAYHDHPVAVRTVAASLKVPLIDLDAKAKVAMEAAGKTYCTRFWHNNYVAGEYANYPNGNTDDVHFQEMGAINNASMIIEGIKELSADVNVSKLIPFIKPQYQATVYPNPVSGSDSVTTRTASYPAGLTITLKTIPKTGKTFQKWNNTSGSQLATTTLTTVSSCSATTYTAIYSGAITTCTTSATSTSNSICSSTAVTLTAVTGTKYQWVKDGVDVLGATAKTYNATVAGSYVTRVSDSKGCTASSNPIVLTTSTSSKWYADTDADGKCDPNISITACTQPTGFVADNTDLCPSDANKITDGNCGCRKTETSCVDCNNMVNGKAVIDNCSRCVAGTTGKVACIAVEEAETDACSFDGIQETTNVGFKGAAYINVNNVVGSSIVFMVNASNPGEATLSFRYANGGTGDRPAQIILNGTTLANNLSFPATGAFITYKTVDVSLTLLKGLNTLKLVSTTAEGLANIDQIGYVSTGVSKGNCVVTSLVDINENQTFVYPNPSKASFHVHTANTTNIQVVNMEGKILEEHKNLSSLEFGVNLKLGIYLLKVDGKVYKVVKE